jgi:biofilm protein TabA
MIIDSIENWQRYPFTQAWRKAFDFISSLDSDVQEARYELQGDEIYAAVEGYQTKQRETARPESHQRYVDIQMVLTGSERIDCWPVDKLVISTPYDATRDIAFYEQPLKPDTIATLTPGLFLVFFPTDAHMPGLQAGTTPSNVKKVVVKIAATCL